jgi:hypothetical protein
MFRSHSKRYRPSASVNTVAARRRRVPARDTQATTQAERRRSGAVAAGQTVPVRTWPCPTIEGKRRIGRMGEAVVEGWRASPAASMMDDVAVLANARLSSWGMVAQRGRGLLLPHPAMAMPINQSRHEGEWNWTNRHRAPVWSSTACSLEPRSTVDRDALRGNGTLRLVHADGGSAHPPVTRCLRRSERCSPPGLRVVTARPHTASSQASPPPFVECAASIRHTRAT